MLISSPLLWGNFDRRLPFADNTKNLEQFRGKMSSDVVNYVQRDSFVVVDNVIEVRAIYTYHKYSHAFKDFWKGILVVLSPRVV